MGGRGAAKRPPDAPSAGKCRRNAGAEGAEGTGCALESRRGGWNGGRIALKSRWNRGGMAAGWRRNGGGAYKSGRGRPLIRPQKQITHKLNVFLAGKKRAGHIIQLSPAHLYAPQQKIIRQTMVIVVARAYKMRFKPALICPRPKISPKRRGTLPAKSHKGHISRLKSAALYAPTAKNGPRTATRSEKSVREQLPAAKNQSAIRRPQPSPARNKPANSYPRRKISPQITSRIIFLYITPRQNLLHCYAGPPPA